MESDRAASLVRSGRRFSETHLFHQSDQLPHRLFHVCQLIVLLFGFTISDVSLKLATSMAH
jgi:hypothetical protein